MALKYKTGQLLHNGKDRDRWTLIVPSKELGWWLNFPTKDPYYIRGNYFDGYNSQYWHIDEIEGIDLYEI